MRCGEGKLAARYVKRFAHGVCGKHRHRQNSGNDSFLIDHLFLSVWLSLCPCVCVCHCSLTIDIISVSLCLFSFLYVSHLFLDTLFPQT